MQAIEAAQGDRRGACRLLGAAQWNHGRFTNKRIQALAAGILPWQVWASSGALASPPMADRLDLQLISAALRRLGWVRFWAQVVLAVVVMGVLLFNNIGGQIGARADKALGLSPGISLTSIAFFVLLWGLWQSWLVIRCGRALGSPVHPSKGETARLIKRGILADLVGLTLGVVGYQSLAGSLFFQASMQAGFAFGGVMTTPGGRITNYPITSLEMLSVLSNTQVVFAHLIGLWISSASTAPAEAAG